jgi:plastocyanin
MEGEGMARMWRRTWIAVTALALSAVLALAFGAGGGGAAVAQGTSASVTIQGFAFSPGTLQIAAGTRVTWTNNDQVAHTVTADDGSFDSGDIAPGGTFNMTFDTAGTIAYHCKIHPNMVASIVVAAAQPSNQPAVAATQPATTGTTATQTPATSLPVTGSGSSIAPAGNHALTALVLAILAAALGLLTSLRGARRR